MEKYLLFGYANFRHTVESFLCSNVLVNFRHGFRYCDMCENCSIMKNFMIPQFTSFKLQLWEIKWEIHHFTHEKSHKHTHTLVSDLNIATQRHGYCIKKKSQSSMVIAANETFTNSRARFKQENDVVMGTVNTTSRMIPKYCRQIVNISSTWIYNTFRQNAVLKHRKKWQTATFSINVNCIFLTGI